MLIDAQGNELKISNARSKISIANSRPTPRKDPKGPIQPRSPIAADPARINIISGTHWRARYAALTAELGEAGSAALSYHAHRQRDDDDVETFLRELGAALESDLQRGMTTVGPHRDDLRLMLDRHDLRRFGSAGQQRTAAVALRLLETAALTDALGTPPIALYDDVFAEFDAERQANLLRLIHNTLPGQAIIAAPRESEVPAALLDRPRWEMRLGTIAT